VSRRKKKTSPDIFRETDIRGAMRAWEDYLRLEPEGKRADWVRGRLEQLKTGAR